MRHKRCLKQLILCASLFLAEVIFIFSAWFIYFYNILFIPLLLSGAYMILFSVANYEAIIRDVFHCEEVL